MTQQKYRLLASQNCSTKKFNLVDCSEPELYRHIFPYDEVPRLTFDGNEPELCPAEKFLITDTTFRDGQQARPPYTVPQMVNIFKILSKMGGAEGLIRKSEFFLYSEKDRVAVEACRDLGLEFPIITGWIRAVESDLKLVKEMGLPETGILTSISDYHIFLKLGLNRRQAMDKYLALIKEALSLGIIPRCHFEDITRADIYGLVVPFAQELKTLSEEAGLPIIIRLCDTMGLAVTYPGAALPRSVGKLVRAMIEDAGYDGANLEWHGHNDFHKGFVNAATAWLYGLGSINGTLLGFGERTGNTPIEALLVEMAALLGHSCGIDLSTITEMASFFEKEIGVVIPPNYPLVGRDFNVTSAGIHADGLLKNEEIYNIFDTTKILGRSPAISINDKSGTAGLAHWFNQRLSLSGDALIDKKHPGIMRMYKQILKEYESGRITNMSSRELEKMARHYLPQCFQSQFDRLKAKGKELAHDLVMDMLENDDIRSMVPARQEAVMEKWVTEIPFVQFLYVTDQKGIKTTNNVTSLHERSIFFGKQVVGEDLSDRIWYINPMEDGKIHTTDFYTSRFNGALLLTVSGPIRDDNDEIVGILGLDIRFEDLAKMEEDDLYGTDEALVEP